MTAPFGVGVDASDLRKLGANMKASQDQERRAVTNAMREVSRGVEKEIEAATSGAQLGRLSRAWNSMVFPRSGNASNPAALVYGKGARAAAALQGHGEGVTIRPGGGRKYLVFPTGFNRAGGRRGGKPVVTPEQMAKLGKGNTFVAQDGDGTVLWWLRIGRAARVRETSKGGAPRFHRSGVIDALVLGRAIRDRKRREKALDYGAVPMFVLQKVLTLRKRFDLNAVAERWMARFPDIAARNRSNGNG